MNNFFGPRVGTTLAANQSVIDRVMPDMLEITPAYWHQFPALNPVWQQVLGCFVFLCGCITIIGNSLVIYIFATTKSLRTPSNLLVINLAISDLNMMV